MERIWLAHYPEGVPHDIEPPNVTVPHLLEASAARWGERPATIFFGKRITYRQLWRAARRFASALAGLGVAPGERLALLLPNCPQAIIAYYGALLAGAIVVQHNPLYTERELEFQLNDSESSTLVTLEIFYSRIKRLRARTSLRRIIITSVREALPFPLNLLYPLKARRQGYKRRVDTEPSVFQFARLLAEAPEAAPEVRLDPAQTVALLQYTGGTTGRAKGAMLTHRNLVANSIQVRHWFVGAEEGREVWMSVLPFFHVFGMTVCMNVPISLGACLVLMPQFDLRLLLRSLQKYRVTMFPGVPAMYVAVVNQPGIERYDLSSVKYCISGAAPMPEEVQRRFEALTGATLIEGYGLTEASPVTHANPLRGRRKIGSIGVALPSTECKVVDLDSGTREVPPGEAGDLCVRGPQVMRGYWRRPEEKQAVLRDGWLHTGDVARLDEDGYAYLLERKKEIILTGGYNVYPREVEEVLCQHPAVLEAAAVGVPHEKLGEVVQAFVVLRQGATAEPQDLVAHCAAGLAAYKVPRTIHLRRELPKTLIGKVLRRVLQEEARQPAPRQTAAASGEGTEEHP
ncbi:MAG: long-chain fatty acid--CoA ligase [Candidatus Tectomicrobia bacterium]|nr:long-chain fatty acid--CoA ligase [Candidatus Tectomicrobia bacterium]